jgi:ABC-2 type transport system permease protein
LRHILRSPDTIITTAVTLIALMLFVYVRRRDQHRIRRAVRQLCLRHLLITIASGVANTAYRLFLDMQGGISNASSPADQRSSVLPRTLTSPLRTSLSRSSSASR